MTGCYRPAGTPETRSKCCKNPEGSELHRGLRALSPPLDRDHRLPLPSAPVAPVPLFKVENRPQEAAAISTRPSYELLPPNSGRGLRRRPASLVAGWRGWRWGCRCRAGNCAERAAGSRPNGRTFTAARCTADGRAGPCTDQAAADRSLAGIIGVCARRQTKRKRQRNPGRRKKCFRHVVTRSVEDR